MMPFAATLIQLETVILSKVNKKEKNKYNMISFDTKVVKIKTGLENS